MKELKDFWKYLILKRGIVYETPELMDIVIKDYLNSIKETVKQDKGIEEKILLPKKLTSENGAKDLLRGEFVEIFRYDDFEQPYIVPIKWDTIKKIYNKIVEHFN